MAEHWRNEAWAKQMWWSGKIARRRFLGSVVASAGAVAEVCSACVGCGAGGATTVACCSVDSCFFFLRNHGDKCFS